MKITGIGACVMDTLVTVPHYPAEDTKLRAIGTKIAGGGPAATGIVAASKLGASSGYIGVLSSDNGGRFLLDDFKKYGVSTENIHIIDGCRSFTSVIWLNSASATRTCVFDKGDLPALKLDEAQKAAIKASEILMIDGNEIDAAEEAVKLCREYDTKVLYDAGGLYDGVERLLRYTDILIPSKEFALGHTGCSDVETAAYRLYSLYSPEIVVITCGMDGGILYDGADLYHYPCYPVKAIDSNGAGDVFHGAFAAGITMGYSYKKCCHFASAVSAIKCTGVGARESVPDLKTVKKFLERYNYEL